MPSVFAISMYIYYILIVWQKVIWSFNPPGAGISVTESRERVP